MYENRTESPRQHFFKGKFVHLISLSFSPLPSFLLLLITHTLSNKNARPPRPVNCLEMIWSFVDKCVRQREQDQTWGASKHLRRRVRKGREGGRGGREIQGEGGGF